MFVLRVIIPILFCFFYLHSPILAVLPKFNSIKLLYPFAMFYFLITLKNNYSYYRNFFTVYKNIVLIFILIFVFTVFRTAFGGSDKELMPSIAAFLEIVFLPMIFILYCRDVKVSKNDFFAIIMFVSALSALVSVIAFLNLGFRLFLNTRVQVVNSYLEEFSFRGFGISESLTYSYSIIQAFMVYIGIVRFKKSKWYLLFIPFVALSVLINARVGLVVLVILLTYYFMANFSLKIVSAFFVLFAVSSFLFGSFVNKSSFLFEWLSQGFLEVTDLIFGTNKAGYSTKDVLLNEMWVLPRNEMEWLIGRGYNIFIQGRETSDIGFLIHLNYGGILYIFLVFLLFYFLFKEFRKINTYIFSLILIFVMLLCYAKGVFMYNSGGFRLVVLVILVVNNLDCYSVKKINKSNV